MRQTHQHQITAEDIDVGQLKTAVRPVVKNRINRDLRNLLTLARDQ